MRIVLDGMGSDKFPDPEVEGAVIAAREFGDDIILTGDEARLRPLLETHLKSATDAKVEIVHAKDVVEMGDKPAFASRQKSENSMAVGLQWVKDGKADAFVTMGNTGAALTNGLFILKRIRGVKRPALTVLLPTRKGRAVLLDIGANADCKPEYLLQFGIMGSVYARKVLGIENPRVATLSNGEEEGKGNTLVKESAALLKKSKLNYIGNVESKEFFAGEAEVVVTDGFTGNIFLKTSESVASFMSDSIRENIVKSPLTTLGGLLVRPAFAAIRKQMDPTEVGGAPLLGLDGIAIVGHGRSNARAVRSAINVARIAAKEKLLDAIRAELAAQLSEAELAEAGNE
ncbi:MAG: phosphate acyltransferase PlsX [Chloroflexi bacterium]|nr:phosphate acyltransferase PlsX [Chloroflexota bacterium]